MFTERKRGSPKSILIVFVFGMVIFLSSLFGHYILSTIHGSAPGLFQYGVLTQGMNVLSLIGNGGSAFLIFALTGVVLFRAHQVALHPIFLVPGIIIVGIIGFTLAPISNMFWMIVNATSGLSASAENFGIMLSFNQNLVEIGMAVSGLVVLVMIGRWRA